MLKEIGKQIDLGKRLMLAFLWLVAPATVLVYWAKAILRITEDLSPEELQKLIKEIKDA